VIFSIVSPAKRGKKSTGGKEGEKRKKEKKKKGFTLPKLPTAFKLLVYAACSYLMPTSY
jgi:hypothetical protein